MWAIVPAAGQGLRMGSGLAKQYRHIAGASVLAHSLRALLQHAEIDGVMVALAPNDSHFDAILADVPPLKPIRRCVGGTTRAESVLAGLQALRLGCVDIVAVHDAARPCVSQTDLSRVLIAAREHSIGAILAERVVDTVKLANVEGRIEKTLDRSLLWRAQTPQVFRAGALTAALHDAIAKDMVITDEAHAMELQNQFAQLVEGSRTNIKITHEADLRMADSFLTTYFGSTSPP